MLISHNEKYRYCIQKKYSFTQILPKYEYLVLMIFLLLYSGYGILLEWKFQDLMNDYVSMQYVRNIKSEQRCILMAFEWSKSSEHVVIRKLVEMHGYFLDVTVLG